MKKENFDKNLYSRYLGLYGLETMKEIIKLNIFIYEMRDPGIEIAKNIILAGPKKVIIYDPNISKISDLTSNFYISIEDVKNENRRDKACIEKLSLLNPYILTEVIKDNNLIEHLEKNSKIKYSIYDVVFNF